MDDRGKDRFALLRVCKHVWNLVQKAGDKTQRQTSRGPFVTLKHGLNPANSERFQKLVSSVVVLLVDDSLRLPVVDQEAVEQRDKHLGRVRHHHHLRLRQCTLHVVEVKDLVVGDEAHLDGRVLRTVLPVGGGGWGAAL